MCDFSLEAVRSRARTGRDKLSTPFFSAGNGGFCVPAKILAELRS
jgi:hypothetical protein